MDPLIFRGSSDPERRKHGLGQIGHFTAMVNAKTNKMGCSKVFSDNYPFKVIYICNYTPRGNIMMLKVTSRPLLYRNILI